MRRPGPALRVALLGTACALVGFALLAAWLGGHAYAYDAARDRATARASGLVVEDEIGDEEDIRVRWTDHAGHVHVQRFGIYDTDRYTKGRRFPVAYDPAQTNPRGFPADPDETVAEDDLLVPLGLIGVAVAFICGVWAWRGLRFVWTARRPSRPMTARVLSDDRLATGWWLSDTTWLALTEPDSPDRATGLQRVMWHPALHASSDPVAVTVHGKVRGRRPVVAVLPDGTRLVPLGRFRHRLTKHLRLDEPETVRADLRDSFILPSTGATVPGGTWWRPGALAAALGAVIAAAMGFFTTSGSTVATVAFALTGATLCTAVWALRAPQPR
ncbi:hypothetical protein ACWCQ0_42255 [Streptomyces massasporeus]|uniref:hypothetical protein n=1 Tax=Streptomyces massasporeus TaxID=67324 RepID=UPI0033D74066